LLLRRESRLLSLLKGARRGTIPRRSSTLRQRQRYLPFLVHHLIQHTRGQPVRCHDLILLLEGLVGWILSLLLTSGVSEIDISRIDPENELVDSETVECERRKTLV
jgi:hypothetical protein